MNALLETLVTISKLEALDTLKKESVDLTTSTVTIVNEVQKFHQEKDITLTTHIQKNISKKVNKESRNIIVKNILENAYKFTPA
jgi:signal transduction histidine kinase